MKLKEFVANLAERVKEDPSILDLEVITSVDDEGNDFNSIYFTPTVMDEDYQQAEVNKKAKYICIN